MSYMLEPPHFPGTYYDASIVYILTGDLIKDAAHSQMMLEHNYAMPQRVIIGVRHE